MLVSLPHVWSRQTISDNGRPRRDDRSEAAPVRSTSTSPDCRTTTAPASATPLNPCSSSPGDRIADGRNDQRRDRLHSDAQSRIRCRFPEWEASKRIYRSRQAGHRSRRHSGFDGPPQLDLEASTTSAHEPTTSRRGTLNEVKIMPMLVTGLNKNLQSLIHGANVVNKFDQSIVGALKQSTLIGCGRSRDYFNQSECFLAKLYFDNICLWHLVLQNRFTILLPIIGFDDLYLCAGILDLPTCIYIH